MKSFKDAVVTGTTIEALTANGAKSLATSRKASVDLFYKTCRGLDSTNLSDLLEKSWKESPLDTLKIMAYVRDIRGGKGERKIFRDFLVWLANNSRKNLEMNLDLFIGEYGRYDDLNALLGSGAESVAINYYSEILTKDLCNIDFKITLAAKWIPSEGKSMDKKHKIVAKIAKVLGVNKAELRTKYLTPLRNRIKIVESQMCSNDWNSINFEHVPSVAMKKYSKAFKKHQEERFGLYLKNLSEGNAKVNAKDLFPHEIVKEYLDKREVDPLLEAQWKVILEKSPKMDDLLVLSDVSGSMSGTPMNVSIALGLLISSLTNEAFRDLVLTFEAKPKFHHVTGDTLFERVKSLEKADWGGNTNFIAAIDEILSVAQNKGVKPEEMPKKLIVISDMQFDYADRNYNTNYEALVRRYNAVGYQVPLLVFWNVNGSTKDIPVTFDTPGAALVSGFSTDILKSILGNEDFTPWNIVRSAIDTERYGGIKYLE